MQLKKVCKKVISRIKLLSRIRPYITPTVAEMIYTSMIKPMFFYCYPLYASLSKCYIDKLQSLQDQAVRVIGTYSLSNLQSIESQYNKRIVLDVYKSLHNIGPNISHQSYSFISHEIETRGNNSLLRLPKVRTEVGKKVSSYRGAIVFNKLNLDMRNEKSFANFKRKITTVTF